MPTRSLPGGSSAASASAIEPEAQTQAPERSVTDPPIALPGGGKLAPESIIECARSPDQIGFAHLRVNALEDSVAPLDLTIGLVGYVDLPATAATIPAVSAPATLTLLAGGLVALARTQRSGRR